VVAAAHDEQKRTAAFIPGIDRCGRMQLEVGGRGLEEQASGRGMAQRR